MSLLKELVSEMAAAGSTGASGVASAQGSLFGGGIVDANRSKRKGRRMLRRAGAISVSESLGVDLGKTEFDASDVISKLDAAERKMSTENGTTAFGMEDEEGNLVKVFVKTEEAEDFEQTLAALLAGADEDDDDRNSSVEIAEVLYKLKDKFQIVDVEWPSIEGDEEEEQEVEDDDEEGDDPEMEANVQADVDIEGEDGDMEGELDADIEGDLGGGEEDAASALTQVIDVMKADAQAKEAEAKAREAEANAKEAEYAAQGAQAKVTQEEQILDMEAYNKSKKDQDKEAKTLAQLAKYKHDLADDEGGSVTAVKVEGAEENEEQNDAEPWRTRPEEKEDGELSPNELGSLIMRHLRAQG